jgi:type IV secretory pathway VirB10-like protein
MPENNTVPEQSAPQLRATIENKAPKPPGLLPKNAQQLVILGVAVTMVLIMWITSGTKRAQRPPTTAATAAQVQAPDPAAVDDFKQSIQKEQAATRQPISPSDLARLQALGLAGDVPPGSVTVPPDGSAPEPGAVMGPSPHEGPQDPIQEDKKKRAYLSLFSTNVAFTYRQGEEADGPTAQQRSATNSTPPPAQAAASALSANPSDGELRETDAQLADANRAASQAAHPDLPSETLPEPQQATKPTPPNPSSSSRPGTSNSAAGKQYVVFEGTVLETVLMNRLNGTFAGPVNCLVTTDLYSHDGQHLLVPAGTKVLGEAKKVESTGQQRLAVAFHRLIMPDGFSVDLDRFTGLNQIGETALRDKVDNHYLEIFGASLAVGILGGVAEAGTGNVFTSSPLDEARAGFGGDLANSSMHILDRFLNVLPTVTIREGNRVKIYLSGDLLLPDYAQHTMEPNL